MSSPVANCQLPVAMPLTKPTDKQIDKLVYELYNLSDDEIAIVEGAE